MPKQEIKNLRSALEVRMGELAALLDDVAEALVYYPGEIEIIHDADGAEGQPAKGHVGIRASAWPTIQELDRVLTNWRALSGLKPDSGGRPRAT